MVSYENMHCKKESENFRANNLIQHCFQISTRTIIFNHYCPAFCYKNVLHHQEIKTDENQLQFILIKQVRKFTVKFHYCRYMLFIINKGTDSDQDILFHPPEVNWFACKTIFQEDIQCIFYIFVPHFTSILHELQLANHYKPLLCCNILHCDTFN